MIRSDTRFGMSEPYERLQEARKGAGYESAAAAAEAMGVKLPTYVHHENGTRGLSRAAVRYAKFFRVSLDWLVSGRTAAARNRPPTVELAGTVGGGATVFPVGDDTAATSFDTLELPDPSNVVGLRVVGDSQYPRYMDGEIILVTREPHPPADAIGRYAMVDTADGRRLIKLLRRPAGSRNFRLESHNAPPEDDVRLTAAYPVLGTIEG